MIALESLLLGAALLALYLATLQVARWGDGPLILRWIADGRIASNHVAYLPVAHAARWILGSLSFGVETALKALSAAATATGVALSFAAARTLGARAVAAAAAALLLALAPTTWFFATCVEVHGLHLAAVGGSLLVLARQGRAGLWGRDAVRPIALLLPLLITHASAFLLAPALALVALRGSGRWRLPRGWRSVGAALAISILATAGWMASEPHALKILLDAVVATPLSLDPRWLWEDAWHGGRLLLAGALAIPFARPVAPPSASSFFPRFAIAAALPYLFFVTGFPYREFGAYLLPVWAVLGVSLALALSRLPARLDLALAVVAAAAVGAQARWAWLEMHAWEHRFPGHEWVVPLREEMEDRGLLLCRTRDEQETVNHHSDVSAVSMEVVAPGWEDRPNVLVAATDSLIAHWLARREPVAITRSLAEHPGAKPILEALARRYGGIERGARAAWLRLAPPDD